MAMLVAAGWTGSLPRRSLRSGRPGLRQEAAADTGGYAAAPDINNPAWPFRL